MRTLIAQLESTAGDLGANASRVERVLSEHSGRQLAVFPELFLSGYELPGASELAIRVDGELVDRIRQAAARHQTAVIAGLIERTEEGWLANSAVCIERDGSLAGVYRKTHLFGAPERGAFAPGEELLVVELAGHRVAPLICFDAEFPEPARAVSQAGAELLVTIAANMEPYGSDHALAMQARALDNRRPHVYVNQIGRHRGLTFVGGSCAIGADARALARADAGEAVLDVDIPVGVPTNSDDVDYLRHVRADLPVRVAPGATSRSGRR